MAGYDVTSQFRDMVAEKQKELPESKRRKLNRPSRRIPGEEQRDGATPLMQEYMREAYNILNHINTLTRMLANIRRPYLDVHSRMPPLSRASSRSADFSDFEKAWADVRHLSNEERDQIDMQARVILSRCADRVKDMEAIEKRRAELVAKETNPLLRLLPARLKHDSASTASDFVAAHNSSVTWYLTRRLAEVSQSQRDMQEERVKRQTERTKTLGSGAAREAAYMSLGEPSRTGSFDKVEGGGASSWLGNASSLASSWASTIGGASSYNPSPSGLPPSEYDDLSSEDDIDDVELTASQIQQFESENAQILRSVEDTLASVQQAESRLLEISELQMELVAQLTRQTEVTDQLYEDAIASSEYVEKGNVQLREARRRARDGRMWILLFLIGASLSLLFLHYY